MTRTPVKSSNLSAVGYDERTQTLEVEFKNGSVYQYSNVPSAVHAGLQSANSVGKYFIEHIQKCYECRRMDR